MEQPIGTWSALHDSTLSERTAHKVSYAQDLLEQPDEYDTIKASSVKGSRAGSVYYSATDSVAQSLSASVNQSLDLDDSDGDFELEVADEPEPSATAHDKAGGGHLEPEQPILSDAPILPAAEGDSIANVDRSDEFDYAFDKAGREGASYKRTFKAEPAPPHLITHLHQAHLGSLAEGSEEGSDCVSEPESGLIDDEDVEPDAASPAAAPSKQVASQDQSDAQGSTHRNSQVHRQAAFETDGMVELNMDDDLEAPSQGPSFSERAGRQHSGVQHTVQQAQHVEKRGRGAALAATHSSNAAVAVPESDQLHEPTRAGLPAADRAAAYQANAVHAAKGVPASSSAITETDPSAIDTQSGRVKSQPSAVNPLAASDTAGTDAAATPAVTGPAAAGPAAAADAATDSLDFQDIALDEVQLSPSTVSKAAEVAAAAAPSRLPGSVQDEWEEVNLARAREVAATVDTAPNPIPGDKVRYPEALGYFLSADIKALKKGLKKSKPTHRLISCFMRVQQSSKRLEKERTRLLCLAKMPFDDNDMMHLRLLQTVYLNFVGGAGPVSRYGAHWAAIGFQGLDPITDLRGCGVLGLLHLLLLHDHDPANAQALYRLSATKESEFPLAPVSLNITKWTIQTLRDRKLSSAARKQQSMVTAASDFYTGTFYTLYNHWKDHKCTMADSGFVLKDMERRACGSPAAMVRQASIRL